MINLYDNYVAGFGLELVFPELQSDALLTALSRSACVMIMSDCKAEWLFESKKIMSG